MTAVATPLSRPNEAQPDPSPTCDHCGAQIESPRLTQRFCSTRCRMLAWERKHRPREYRKRALACGPSAQAGLFEDPIELRAERFHRQHPEVYAALRRLALGKRRSGARRIGMKALWEVARWELECGDDEGFKLNNNYTAWYARLLMEREPELAEAFETRRRRAA